MTAEARKTRATIVRVAELLFKRYGYGKTTIVDIARECAMSHANVYRFFRNKAQLADAVAAVWLDRIVEAGKRAAQRPGSVRERLIGLSVELYLVKKREFLRTKSAHELMAYAEVNGQPSVDVYRQRIRDIYAALIEEGRRDGELRDVDSDATAEGIMAATVLFSHPLLMEQFQDDDLEPKLRTVMDILTAGLMR